VSKCIKQLKRNGSVGPDNFTTEFHKVTDSFVQFLLSLVFNLFNLVIDSDTTDEA